MKYLVEVDNSYTLVELRDYGDLGDLMFNKFVLIETTWDKEVIETVDGVVRVLPPHKKFNDSHTDRGYERSLL